MSNSMNWLGWIDLDDETQCEWAFKYATKMLGLHAIRSSPGKDKFKYALQEFDSSLDVTNSKERNIINITKMRSAWTQKKYRDSKNGLKSYSFVMSIDIQKKLKQLANGQPINKYLEHIIYLEHDYAFAKLVERKQEIADFKHRLEDKYSDQVSADRERINRLKLKAQKLERENKLKDNYVSNLLFQIAKLELLMGSSNTDPLEPTSEQKEVIMSKTQKLFRYFKKEIQSELSMVDEYSPDK